MSTTIQGMTPAKQPKKYDSQSGFPGCSYFSINRPKRTMQALMQKTARMAAKSTAPQIMVMSITISDAVMEYSIQRP